MVKYFVLVLLFLGLRTDYKRDFGEHKKAKRYHAIILGVFIVLLYRQFKIFILVLR